MSDDSSARSMIGTPAAGQDGGGICAPQPNTETNRLLAAVERIELRLPKCLQDVAQTMRERGLNPVACLEIETFPASVLVGTSLQDASGHHAQSSSRSCNILSRESGEGRWAAQMPRATPNNPLAALKAMTDEERIAALHMTNEARKDVRP
jgi:hypothetical protein